MKKILTIAFLAGVVFAIGFVCGKRSCLNNDNVLTDTIYVTATKIGVSPRNQSKWTIGAKLVSVPKILPLSDTLVRVIEQTDTFRVEIPLSQSYYSLNDGKLRLWTTGYDVSIDRWEVDEVTGTVEKYRPHNIWIGADVYAEKNPRLVVSANYGYSTKRGLELNAGIGYSPTERQFIVRGGVGYRLY